MSPPGRCHLFPSVSFLTPLTLFTLPYTCAPVSHPFFVLLFRGSTKYLGFVGCFHRLSSLISKDSVSPFPTLDCHIDNYTFFSQAFTWGKKVAYCHMCIYILAFSLLLSTQPTRVQQTLHEPCFPGTHPALVSVCLQDTSVLWPVLPSLKHS